MLPTPDSVKTLAALHTRAGTARLLIVALGPAGPSVQQTLEAPSTDPAAIAALSQTLTKAGVDLLVRVLPACATVARVAPLPAGPDGAPPDEADVVRALALLAETDLPAALPPFRRAAGVLAMARTGPGRPPQALVTGWSPPGPEDPWRDFWPGPQVGVSEIAALGALCAVAQATVGAIVDASSGAVAVLARSAPADNGAGGAEPVLARASRVPTGAAAPAAAARVIAETLRAARVEAPISPHDVADGLHLVPDRGSLRLLAGERSADWLARYGLCAAALTLYTDPSPAVRSLVNLHQIAPTARPPILERLTGWLGAPARAAAIIALCVLVLLGLPVGVAWARMRAVEKTVTDEPALLARTEQAERELAFYKVLSERRWPMTKLLADVAGATPVGIVLESCEIAVGTGDALIIRGRADSAELVTTLRENLNKLRIFEQVTTPSTSPLDDGVQFQLNARVTPGRAAAEAPPIDDFAAKTLSERLYGPSARPGSSRTGLRADRAPSAARPRPGASAGSSRAADSSRNGSASSRAPASTQSRSGSAGQNAAADPPPPPLTDAQIAKMNGTQAMLEWGKRRRAAAQPGLDEATRTRLTAEAEKCKARMQEAKQQEGSRS